MPVVGVIEVNPTPVGLEKYLHALAVVYSMETFGYDIKVAAEYGREDGVHGGHLTCGFKIVHFEISDVFDPAQMGTSSGRVGLEEDEYRGE